MSQRWVYKNLIVGIKKVRVLMLGTFGASSGYAFLMKDDRPNSRIIVSKCLRSIVFEWHRSLEDGWE